MKRALIACLIAGAAVLTTAAPVSAHNALVSSDPKDKASLEAGPAAVTLTFDQDVQGGKDINTISVVDANGGHYEVPGDPTIKDNAVTAKVNALGKAGQYKIGYRILSADGHPVSGELTFTLTKDGTGTPTTPADADASSGGDSGGGIPLWVWIAGAVVLLGGGVFLALRGGGAKA
ncbi:copper resistance CopC family protein [Nocardia sp. NRRL S-836]|uniref:copper resistance CopC family protein n=1 Tax=Nocardia sp. NRRL S-836 TaxID=1519492 RepID=UPI0006AE9F48|nr:copper resistance CopC family protein [Nocardia sp. NRRL S-836]KOV88921.1 copper resistance protein CopC [Nocardia sp. NRRL S-836]